MSESSSVHIRAILLWMLYFRYGLLLYKSILPQLLTCVSFNMASHHYSYPLPQCIAVFRGGTVRRWLGGCCDTVDFYDPSPRQNDQPGGWQRRCSWQMQLTATFVLKILEIDGRLMSSNAPPPPTPGWSFWLSLDQREWWVGGHFCPQGGVAENNQETLL